VVGEETPLRHVSQYRSFWVYYARNVLPVSNFKSTVGLRRRGAVG
jgi:hypothetical protein